MATATDVTILRQEERKGDLIYRIRVVEFTLDVGNILPGGIDLSTATVAGLDPALDFVMGVQHTDDISHAVVHEVHVGATDTLHILSHNNSGGNVDQVSMVWRVVVARLKL